MDFSSRILVFFQTSEFNWELETLAAECVADDEDLTFSYSAGKRKDHESLVVDTQVALIDKNFLANDAVMRALARADIRQGKQIDGAANP